MQFCTCLAAETVHLKRTSAFIAELVLLVVSFGRYRRPARAEDWLCIECGGEGSPQRPERCM